VDVGVRPEKIRIQDVGVELRPTDNRLHGVITDTLYTGVSTQVRVALADGTSLTIYEQNLARASRSDAWRPGDQVDLGWAPDDTFAVDPLSSGAGSSTEAATGQPS
jgi:spermidine/putrescine transport system ATP-binding protein